MYFDLVLEFTQMMFISYLVSSSQGLADNTVVAKVNGDVWDLDRPFEGDASLQLLKFTDDEGRSSF